MCGGDVGLARHLSKVNKTCDSPPSGTQTPQKHSEARYSMFMDVGETSNPEKVKKLTF